MVKQSTKQKKSAKNSKKASTKKTSAKSSRKKASKKKPAEQVEAVAHTPSEQIPGSVSWEASEYIHHEKTVSWYVVYVIFAGALIAGTYFILEDLISIIVISMMAIVVIIFANRQPRSLRYRLDDTGITIEEKTYPYSAFKSFSLVYFGVLESVYLEPLERFMPPISIYFSPEDGDQIIGILGQYLPHRDREPDLIDQLVHRIRL